VSNQAFSLPVESSMTVTLTASRTSAVGAAS
jgi:hypothetical protein